MFHIFKLHIFELHILSTRKGINLIIKIIDSIIDRTLVQKVRYRIRVFLTLFFGVFKNKIDYDYYHFYIKKLSNYSPLDKMNLNHLNSRQVSHKFLLELKESYPEIYSKLIYFATKHQELKKYDFKEYNVFLENVKKTDLSNLKPISLLLLSTFSFTVGTYELSKIFRDAYIQFYSEKTMKKSFFKTAYILGLFDRFDIQKLNTHVHLFDSKTLQYLDILKGQSLSIEFKDKEIGFYNDIKDKRIAILGPTTDDKLDIKKLLNEFDYLVVMNYKDISPIEKEIPKERLISYYNPPNLLMLNQSNLENVLAAPKYSVFAPAFGGTAEKIQLKNMLSKTNCRKLVSYHQFYLMGYPNMLQYIIFDLLTFNPKQMKIYNVNFFLLYESYDSRYLIDHETKKNIFDRWHSHSSHNVLSQYKLTRYLLSHPRISFSDRVLTFLNLGEDEYLTQMKKEYVNKHLLN